MILSLKILSVISSMMKSTFLEINIRDLKASFVLLISWFVVWSGTFGLKEEGMEYLIWSLYCVQKSQRPRDRPMTIDEVIHTNQA